jgi:type IV pilus assembly protein PilB
MVDEPSLLEQGISDGMLTLRASGRERIKQGITTLEAVAAATTE